MLAFGARQISNVAIWLLPWFFDSAANIQSDNNGPLSPALSGRVRDMRVRHFTTVASTDDITYTLFVNDNPTALTVTMNTSTAAGSDLVNVLNVGATDELNVRATGATVVRNLRTCVQLTLEY